MLNIPTPAHLAALASTIPTALLSTESLGSDVAFRGVFLSVGPSVIASPVLESYLSALRASFPSLTVHVSSADFVGEGKNEITFGPASLLSLRLRQLDEQMFPLPHYSFLPPDAPPPPSLLTDMSVLAPSSHFSSTLALLPAEKSPFGTSARTFEFDVPSPQADAEAARLKGPEKPAELQQRAAVAWSEYVQKAKEAKEAVARQTEDRQSRTAEDGLVVPASEGSLVVTPLGTGSAVPSKYRNVSGTLLHLPQEDSTAPTQYILLDAGEGTWGQIARRFGDHGGQEGEDSAEDVLRGIKMVFLSHLHQDHHAGMSTILKKRAQVRARSNLERGCLLIVLLEARPAAAGSACDRGSTECAHLPRRAAPAA